MIGRGSTAPAQQPTPLPLAVFRDVSYCDTRHEHEITLISDGRTAYAHGDATDCGTVSRDTVTLSVTCGQPGRDDEACDGQVEFSIDTEGTWTADPDARRLLAQHGTEVDR
jgi:hypothetical protein